MGRLPSILSVVLLCVSPRLAVADDTHYQDYPVGGRAIGLGGAFTALANDPSGVYFNPAGLVDQRLNSVQVSTNLYGLEVADSFFNAVGRVTDFDTVFTELNIIPSTAAFSGVLHGDKDGRAITSYGLGVFVPSFRSLNVQTSSEINDPQSRCEMVSYSRSLSDRTFVLGGSAAHRWDDTWSIGSSLLASYRLLRETEDVACSAGTNRFSTATTNVNLAVAAIRASVGIKGRFGPHWRVGATFFTPSIRLFDVASVGVRRGDALSGGEPDFFSRDLDGLRADTQISAQLRLGGAYIWPKQATLTLDLSFHAGTRYDLYDIPAGEQRVEDAITTVRSIVRNPVVNVNIGAEYLFTKEFSISLGLFTNMSTAEPIDGRVGDTFERDRLPRVHAGGGSLVFGFFGKHTLTRFGASVSYGDGSDVVPRTPGLAVLGEPDEFVKVDFSQLFAFVFVSSTFRY